MNTLPANLERFAQNINEKNLVICDPKTLTFKTRPAWMNFVYELFGFNEPRLHDLGISFCSYLDILEKTPVTFKAVPIESQKSFYSTVIQVSNVVRNVLIESNSPTIKRDLANLDFKVAALKYRIESVNGGKDIGKVDLCLKNQISELALKWKGKTAIFFEKSLNSNDLNKIERVSQYKDFCEIILNDKSLKNDFFSWILRDNMGVDQFVQFPATMQRIKTAFLAPRIGRLGNELLQIEKKVELKPDSQITDSEVKEKIVSLPYDLGSRTERLNILDESKEINLSGIWKLKIKDIFDEFASKNRRIGDVEFFKSCGITAWNSFEQGRWNDKSLSYDQIDLNDDHWWQKLPVLEEISMQELEEKYSIKLKEDDWLLVGKAGRESVDLDLNKNHGFLEVFIPTGNGTFKTYPFGSYSSKYPFSTFETLNFIANTQDGRISYPDENTFYSHRQIASFPFLVNKEQGKALMDSIRKDLVACRMKNHIFQFAGDNCAYWAQKKLNAASFSFPSLYQIKIIKSSPHNPILKVIIGTIKKAPEFMHASLLEGMYTVFGGRRSYAVIENGKKIYKSVVSAVSTKTSTIYHPANLHELIINGKLPGRITTGHA